MDIDMGPRPNQKIKHIAVIALTKKGTDIAGKLNRGKGWDIYVSPKHLLPEKKTSAMAIEGEFIKFIHGIFHRYCGLVFVCAAGIAVRAIAGVLRDKRSDPAVVVVDDGGNYAISLLSGHIGGANRLAREVAKILGSTPVLTTASDISGFAGIDVIAKDLGLYIDNFGDLKHVSAALVNGDNVALIPGDDGDPKELKHLLNHSNILVAHKLPSGVKAAVYFTDHEVVGPSIPHVILRPRNIVLGIGAKCGASFSNLLGALDKLLLETKLSKNSIRGIATIDIKREETCILELGKLLKVPIHYFTARELAAVEGKFPSSAFVKKTVGVGSVARPSGFLASSFGEEQSYYKGDGITLAIYKGGSYELDKSGGHWPRKQ